MCKNLQSNEVFGLHNNDENLRNILYREIIQSNLFLKKVTVAVVWKAIEGGQV